MEYFRIILFSFLLGSLISCGGGSSTDTNNPDTTTLGSGIITGMIKDAADGLRLKGVNVSVNGQTVTSDDKGEFTLTNLTSRDYVVTFEKADYAPGYANVALGDKSETLLLSLKKEGKKQDYDTSSSATIYENTINGPYAVIFEPNTLDTNDTQLKVSVTPLDPTVEEDALPGQLETSTAMLVPLTFAEFSIFDSKGKRVNLLAGKEAIVELPIPISLRKLPEYAQGKTIHCYSYNPVTGQWEDFVVGTVTKSSIDNSTPVVRASIKHFSWYGAAPQSSDCIDIYGQVISAATGAPLPFARVEAFPGSATTSDANGMFRLTTAASGQPKISASRTFIDTDGGITGTPGARVIEYGSVADIPLVGLVTRPCSSTPGSNPNNQTSTEPGSENNPIKIQLGNIGALNYEAIAYLLDDSVIALLNEKPNDENADTGNDGVSGAKITLTGPDGMPITLEENLVIPGMYSANLTPLVGQRYTLNIDVENNGSIDGSGSIFVIGDVSFTKPTNNTTVSGQNLEIAWHDTAFDEANVDPAYTAIYWVWIFGSNNSQQSFSFDSANYLGTDLSFIAKSTINEGEDLVPGEYSASILSSSGAYQPTLGNDFSATLINNITGPTVSGQFYSYSISSNSINFTIE